MEKSCGHFRHIYKRNSIIYAPIKITKKRSKPHIIKLFGQIINIFPFIKMPLQLFSKKYKNNDKKPYINQRLSSHIWLLTDRLKKQKIKFKLGSFCIKCDVT